MTFWALFAALYLAIGLAVLIGEARYGFGGMDWPEVVGLVLFWPLVALIVLCAFYYHWRQDRKRSQFSEEE